MWPYLEIAGEFFPTYNLLLSGGIFVGLLVLFYAARRKRIALQFLADHFFVLLLTTLLGSRIAEVLLSGYSFQDLPFFWRDTGLNFYGGVLGFLLTLALLCRAKGENFFAWLDLMALASTATLIFHYLGAFAAGTLYGIPTKLPWGVTFTNPDSAKLTDLPIHPTQLYAAGATLVFFVLAALIFKRTRTAGKTGIFLVLTLSLAYFLNDFLRDDSAPAFWHLRASQYFELLFTAAAALFTLKMKRLEKQARLQELTIQEEPRQP